LTQQFAASFQACELVETIELVGIAANAIATL
jgi:hypothetical protein